MDLLHNDLIALPEDIGSLRKLQCLYLQHNDIVALPDFDGCEDLQELHLANNYISVYEKKKLAAKNNFILKTLIDCFFRIYLRIYAQSCHI